MNRPQHFRWFCMTYHNIAYGNRCGVANLLCTVTTYLRVLRLSQDKRVHRETVDQPINESMDHSMPLEPFRHRSSRFGLVTCACCFRLFSLPMFCQDKRVHRETANQSINRPTNH